MNIVRGGGVFYFYYFKVITEEWHIILPRKIILIIQETQILFFFFLFDLHQIELWSGGVLHCAVKVKHDLVVEDNWNKPATS